ncbi:SRPBCC family protein [Agilicoccus flavus]|uniref:SRPBCC family protein n=1 Tax=Agilicoccus flavus TaxID=2775968 RepID=UPI001CF61C93|nr:SRPBCC family protein [Agilicoccus flavus]
MRTYTVSRSRHVDAPPPTVQAHVADFRAWPAWSPWEDLDPQMRHDYTGPQARPGARHTWKGNRKAGEGSMQIVSIEPGRITLDLRFVRPFASHSEVEFTFVPQGGGTDVTWTMHGQQRGLMALAGRVVSMDKLLGRDLDTGLARLDTVARG